MKRFLLLLTLVLCGCNPHKEAIRTLSNIMPDGVEYLKTEGNTMDNDWPVIIKYPDGKIAVTVISGFGNICYTYKTHWEQFNTNTVSK